MSTPPLTPDEIERLATKRAKSKLRWFMHFAIFVVVNLFWLANSDLGFGHRAWSFKPTLGWTGGLMLHGISVWFLGTGSDLRERMVQKERERLQRQHRDQ